MKLIFDLLSNFYSRGQWSNKNLLAKLILAQFFLFESFFWDFWLEINQYGIEMESVWNWYRIGMESVWHRYGIGMTLIWNWYEIEMELIISMELMWNQQGIGMESISNWHAIDTKSISNRHGESTQNPPRIILEIPFQSTENWPI